MSEEDNGSLRRTVGDMEIARIRALAHEKPGDKVIDHRNYLDLPPGSGTSVHARESRGKIRAFFSRLFPFLLVVGCLREQDPNRKGLPKDAVCAPPDFGKHEYHCVGKRQDLYLCIYDEGVTACAYVRQ